MSESRENIRDSETRDGNHCSTKIRQAGIELCVFSRAIKDSAVSTLISDIRDRLQKGQKELTQLSIFGAKKSKTLNQLDESGCSVLHYATRYNRLEAVRELLESGANVNVRSLKDRISPLHIASRFGWNEITRTLLEHGAEPTIKSETGCTPLHFACKRGNKQVVSLLLDVDNIDVNVKDKSCMTPLHLAAIQGDAEICGMLIRKGADYREQADDLTTPLHAAVSCGNKNVANVILKKALAENPDLGYLSQARDIDSNSILHLASLTNNLEIAGELLDHGASVDATTLNLSTPLHLACAKGHATMVKLLLEKKADMEAKDIDGRSPLHICAQFNQTSIITHLLDKGASIESRDFTNRTPFLTAVTAGQTKSTCLLVSRGTDVTSCDSSMKSCIHLAVENKNIQTLSLILENEKCLENLNKPDVNERVPLHYAAMCDDIKILQAIITKQKRFVFHDENQKTPLHLACESGRAEQAEILAHAGSSINDRNDEGKTALHIAASSGHRKVCSKLVRLGADVSIRDNNRWTPLMCAANTGSSKTCADLLDAKASIDDVNNEGDSALLIATRSGNACVVKILLDYEASVTIRNNEGSSLIEIAAKYGVQDVMMEVSQHPRWREVMDIKDSRGHPAMKLLIQHFPNVAQLIMNYCVQKAPYMNQSDPAYTVTYDFSLLDPGPDDPAALDGHPYFGPLTMVKHNRQQLLEHPLTQELLEYTWLSFGRIIFYFNFTFYIVFTSCFTAFVVTERSALTFQKNGNVTYFSSIFKIRKNKSIATNFSYFVILFALLQVIKELTQMFLQGRKYFKEISNALEWILYSSAIGFMLPYTIQDTALVKAIFGQLMHPHYLWISGVISIFACYINLVLFTRRFRITGIYVTMFLEVVKTICKVMTVFGIFVVAFALVFYIIFKEQVKFRTVGHSLLTVMAMMAGELDYVNTFVVPVSQETVFVITSYWFCFMFMVIMSLAVMNLLIGLAVGDIDYIQRDAVLKRLAMQVEFIAEIQSKYPRFVTRRYYKSVVVSYPNKITLKTRIRDLFFSTKISAEKGSASSTEDVDDEKNRALYVYNKLKKTQKQVKSLVQVIEIQNRLLKALAKKIDPSLDVMSMSEEDWIQTTDAFEERQFEVDDFDANGSHGNESSHEFTYSRI